jgi:hypothetical protein
MPDDRNPFERGSLLDAGIDYDDAHRVRVGTMVFRESLSGFANRQTTGFGFSLAWQFAPLLSLRAWTLHDAAQQSSAPLPYIPYAPLGLSRSVVWFSYDNSPGVRFDAIVHRDVFGASEETDVDGGIALPIARGIALTFGTQRSLGRRSVYAGLRLP